MKIVAFCLLILIASGCKSRSVNKSNEESQGKENVLKLNPGANNPRNSEGDFITLKDGRIMFIYSHYTGNSSHDNASAYLAARYSSDKGKTWTKEDKVIIEKEGRMNVMSVSLLRLKNGEIALFYLKKNSTSDCIPIIRISKDEAKTWSEPSHCITDKEGYFTVNNNRVIQLKNGRLLMAVGLHQIPNGEWQNKATLYTYHSDDNGATWTSSEAVPNTSDIFTQEPGVVELKDGTIMMFIRASGGIQQLSYSKDKGETWSHIESSNIKSPLSPASITRIPSTGDLLMVWNNNGQDQKRTPFNIGISKDEGKSWSHIKTLEDDPDGWYCYTAIHFTDKDVLLGYCAGNRPKGTGLAVTQITKLSLNWIYK